MLYVNNPKYLAEKAEENDTQPRKLHIKYVYPKIFFLLK